MSNQVPLTIKIDADLKNDVQKLAKNMGLSLSAVIENKLREVRNERRIVFEEQLVPNAKTAKAIREAEADWRAGRHENFSGPFENVDEAFDYLKTLPHAD